MTSPEHPSPTVALPATPLAVLHRAASGAGARWGRKRRRLPPRATWPLLAMMAGALLPRSAGSAAHLAPYVLALSVLLSTVSLPSVDSAERSGGRSGGQALVATLSILLVGPALTACACLLAGRCGLDLQDWGWATMAAGAPVSVGAVLTARTLGLGQRRMAGVMMLSNLGAPLVLPQLAWAAGITGAAGAEVLARQMALTSGLPVLVGVALRLLPAAATPAVRRAAATGGMGALMTVGLLRGMGLSGEIANNLPMALPLLALAGIVAACGTVAAWLILRLWPDAVLVGLFRSNTLVWASLTGVLTERANLLMAFVMMGTYAAPALTALVQRAARHS